MEFIRPFRPCWRSGCAGTDLRSGTVRCLQNRFTADSAPSSPNTPNSWNPSSLDEAFLDVSHARSATLVAREIKARILAETGLTASAGISVNKMLAKIASDYRKPDGLFTIPPERIEEFVAGLPIERFFGIGEVTAEKMHRLGSRTGADLRLWNETALVQQFGKAGHSYYGYARGIDEREVTPNRVRKSLGAETTFAEDTDDREQLPARIVGRARGGLEPADAA